MSHNGYIGDQRGAIFFLEKHVTKMYIINNYNQTKMYSDRIAAYEFYVHLTETEVYKSKDKNSVEQVIVIYNEIIHAESTSDFETALSRYHFEVFEVENREKLWFHGYF